MEIILPSDNSEKLETQGKAEVLEEIEPQVAKLMDSHKKKRKMWFPSEFLPADEQMDENQHRILTKLRDRARSLSDAVRVSIAMNLITEEGLPHFHRLLATYLKQESVWQKWNFLWTAEEDRHGCVLRDYVRDTRLLKFRHIEMMQFAYLEKGFTPSWDKDPYRVFAYTTLQERATQVSHRNTGKAAGDEEPMLKGILANVAADEARHFTFYRNVFKHILEVDPNRALQSALAILPSIEMPGVSMPNFHNMADIIRRIGIYGPWDYLKIVEESIDFWKIDLMTGLNEAGRKAQERIMKIPDRLLKVAKYIDHKTEKKTFSFDFIYNRAFSL